jgi:Membrane protein involved in the export of O-antigen and teichoic acid
MQEESLKNKTAKGLFWGGIGSGSQQIIQLISGIIMLNLLSPEDYGTVGVLYVFTAIALTIQDGGFISALVNKKKIYLEDFNAVFWFSIMVSIVMYIALYFAAPLIADYFGQPKLILISRVLFLSFLVGGIGIAQHAYILKELMVKEKVKIEIGAVFISGTVGVVFAYLGYAYWAIVIQNVLYFAVTITFRWFYCPWKPTFSINFHPLKEMFPFSMKLFFTNIFTQTVNNIFPVILGKYYNEQQVGYYVQGNKWSVMGGAFIMNMITGVAQPVLARMTGEKERQRNAFRKMLRFGAFISFPLLLGLGFVAEEFFWIVGQGDKWLAAVPFLQVFCIWYSANYIWTLYTNLLIAQEKLNIYMIGMIIVGSLQLLVVVLLFPFGIFPMLIAYVSVYFLGLLFWHYFAHRLIGLQLWNVIKDIAPYVLATVGCISISWLITSGLENIILRFILKIVITAILYISIMWFSNSVIVRESFGYIKNMFCNKNQKS